MPRGNNQVIDYVVIGSGPAGWAALDFLVSIGAKPTLIDIRNTESSDLVFETPGSSSASAIAQKARFGSHHMYTYPSNPDLTFDIEGTIPITSAFGGLSTVWGTNLQGFDWPGSDKKVAKKFSDSLFEVIQRLPTTGSHDGLEEIYNWPVSFRAETTNSPRSNKIIKRMPDDSEWSIGKARNATAGKFNGCISCGQCLTGCPEGVIFSTEKPVQQMLNTSTIDFVSGQVLRLTKTNSDIWEIEVEELETKTKFNVYAKNVYLGAGSIASSIILVRSNLIPDTVFLDDTQVVYLPFLSFRDSAAKQTEFSLAQIFLETKNGLFEKDSLHISLYEHSESFRERAAKIFPRLAPLLPAFVFRRLMAGIAFLPSEVSGKIQIAKTQQGIKVSSIEPPNLGKTITKLFQRIGPTFIRLGLIPMKFFSSSGNVGSSYHLGTLKSRSGILSNDNGQIQNAKNLYLIDSCSLTKIPAGPITLGIMANSRRITEESIKN